jgi:hypothetical protein
MTYYIIAALILVVIRLEYVNHKLNKVIKYSNQNFYVIQDALNDFAKGVCNGKDY